MSRIVCARRALCCRLLSLTLLCTLGASLAGAANDSPSGDNSAARIDALEALVQQLQAKLERIERRQDDVSQAFATLAESRSVASIGSIPAAASAPAAPAVSSSMALAGEAQSSPQLAPAAAQPAPTVSVGPEGFTLQSADKQERLQIRYQVQVDGRFGINRQEPSDPDSFYLRRTQPIFSGTLYGRYGYQMMLEFAQGKPRINDAYVDIPANRGLNFRIGKAKGPVGLERLRSGMALMLVERGLPTELLPNRELGLQLFGTTKHDEISYAVGVFNGVVDQGSTDGDANDSKDVQARVFLEPFHQRVGNPLKGLGLGIAGTYGTHDGGSAASSLAAYTTSGARTFFAYRGDTRADGRSFRYVPQGYYYVGPFGVMSEYAMSSQQVARGVNRATLRNSAWQVAGSFVLTGEDGSFGGTTPRQQFDPSNGDWGAWEITARYNEMRLDRDSFPFFSDSATYARAARAWAVGVNWYLNRNMKLVLNYENTDLDEAQQGVVLKPERVFLERLQFRF